MLYNSDDSTVSRGDWCMSDGRFVSESVSLPTRTAQAEADAITQYLSVLGEEAVLSRSQESRLTARLDSSRSAFRFRMLTCLPVLVGVIDILEKIECRHLRLDRQFDLAVSDVDRKNEIRRHLAPNIAELKLLVRSIRKEFGICLRKSATRSARETAWRSVVGYRRQAAHLAESLGLRTSLLVALYHKAQASGSRMVWLRNLMKTASKDQPACSAQVRTTRRELGRLMLLHADSPATFERRVQRVEASSNAWAGFKKQLAGYNLRFVVSIAKQYRGKELPFIDLIQEGNVGLMRAIERFDPSKGYRLTTYAESWIRQAIQAAMLKAAGPVTLPNNFQTTARRIRKSYDRLLQRHGRPPHLEELAADVGVTAERLRKLLPLTNQTISLSQEISASNNSSPEDFLEGPTGSDADQPPVTSEQIQELMEFLEPRERNILSLRYGLSDGVAHSLTDIGRRYQLSRERIRQIENRAVRKLRHPKCLSLVGELMP